MGETLRVYPPQREPEALHPMESIPVSRRKVLQAAGALAAASFTPRVFAQTRNTIKIGFVSPRTGPLAAFAEPDDFVLDQLRRALGPGLKVGGRTYSVEVVYKDSQSNPNRAAEVTADLIFKDRVHLVVAGNTPETTVPVADQCELNGVPCITNDTPWQPYFFSRGGDPKRGFEWTYHYFWGLEDIIAVYTSMWGMLNTNKVIGALWPNDPDGNAWSDPSQGFPPVLSRLGYKLVDPGRFKTPADDFSAYITAFRQNGADIITGVLPTPDFANFWNQALRAGLRPKAVTAAKATEFPAAVKALGEDQAAGLTIEVWWSPAHPFHSSLTGQSSKELAAAYTQATGRPWSVSLGFKHALFETAVDALRRAADLGRMAVRDAIRTMALDTIVGHIDFRKGPVPNIAKTPLVGGQWKRTKLGLELLVVENSQAKMVPIQAELEPIRYS